MDERSGVDTLVVGCGNLMRGDDGVGPTVVRLLAERDLPDGVRLLDVGTAGMDVAFAMRGVHRVFLIDAASTGATPGTVHRVPAEELVGLAPPAGDVHHLRWDEALGFARWLLADDHPDEVTVYLVEGAGFELGAPLSAAVEAAAERVAGIIEMRLR